MKAGDLDQRVRVERLQGGEDEGVLPTDRVMHEGTAYGISSVINPRSGGSELVLMCKSLT